MPNQYKEQIITKIDGVLDVLWGISEALFHEPEVAFKEYKACQLLANALRDYDFTIETGIGGLETAFRGSYGTDNHPAVAILAEYDALVELGHACGHNLIAAAAIGAGISLSKLTPKLPGRVEVIGTPAEEGGGGKIRLLKAGIFDSIDAAMMFHPASKNLVLRPSLASAKLKLEFIGKAAHAAAAPEEGINALDALILTYNNINAIRPTFGPKDRVAGIIVDGGKAANIVPAHSAADFSIRSLTAKRRDVLVDKVISCAQSAAQTIGCRLEYKLSPGYREMVPNKTLAGLFKLNLESLGRIVSDPDPNERMGSTDMGDVSHVIPAIHPYLAMAPENVAGHTLEFKGYCLSEAGKSAMLDAAKAMAMTTVDLLTQPDLLSRARDELLNGEKS
ncbi:MAG TPA: M20 family metallopeptidase [Anaerolineales bacterium]